MDLKELFRNNIENYKIKSSARLQNANKYIGSDSIDWGTNLMQVYIVWQIHNYHTNNNT